MGIIDDRQKRNAGKGSEKARSMSMSGSKSCPALRCAALRSAAGIGQGARLRKKTKVVGMNRRSSTPRRPNKVSVILSSPTRVACGRKRPSETVDRNKDLKMAGDGANGTTLLARETARARAWWCIWSWKRRPPRGSSHLDAPRGHPGISETLDGMESATVLAVVGRWCLGNGRWGGGGS